MAESARTSDNAMRRKTMTELPRDKLLRRVTVDPDVCHGKACIQGTRVMVSVVLANLADGLSAKEIVEEYPSLTSVDVQAAVAYGAELAVEQDITPLRGRSRH